MIRSDRSVVVGCMDRTITSFTYNRGKKDWALPPMPAPILALEPLHIRRARVLSAFIGRYHYHYHQHRPRCCRGGREGGRRRLKGWVGWVVSVVAQLISGSEERRGARVQGEGPAGRAGAAGGAAG